MFGNTAANGQLTVDTVDMVTPMTRITNLAVLLADEAVVGDDTRVSGGKVLNPQRGDGLRETLNLLICGDVDSAGTPYGDPVDGLISNIFYIRTTFTTRTGVGDGTRALGLAWGGDTLTGTGRVGPLQIGGEVAQNVVTATCDIWLPVTTFA